MPDTVDVVRHDITDRYSWPREVAEIIQGWSRPLPKRLASDDFKNILPPATRRTLEEALKSPKLKLGSNDICEETPRPVTDVIDTILSSVRMVKAADSFGPGRGQQQARMSWTSLICGLGMAISEDVFLAEDLPFLMPRTKARSKPQQAEDLEKRAVILLCVFIRRRARNNKTADKCDEKKSVGSSECHSSISDTSYLTLDVPLDAHVLPGRGKRVDCCLPVVCAADEDAIEGLVTSVVCQRYVWNISLPVVGVSLSNSGTSATIVIGWSEVVNKSQGVTPVIHLALSTRKAGRLPSLGQFDLVDSVSALYFGQFILGLCHQFTSLEEWSKVQQTQDYCWRLDHVDHPCAPAKLDLSTNNKSLVETWLSELPVAGNAERSISRRTRSLLSPTFR